MRIVLSEDLEYDNDFVEWLIDIIRYKIIAKLDRTKLIMLNQYLNNNEDVKSKLGIITDSFDLFSVVVQSLSSITYRNIGTKYFIEIDPTVRAPKQLAKVAALCRFINYGGFNIKGYPLYTDVFNYVKSNINLYYEKYLNQFVSI